MPFLKSDEVISGREGMVQATIDGVVRELAEIRTLEANAALNKTEFKVLGFRGTYNKVTGFTCSGSMTMYYNTSLYAQIVEIYMKTGVIVPIDIIVLNEDPSSSIGKQRVRLNGVILNEVTVAKVDAEAEFIDSSADFSYVDFDILDKFSRAL